MTIAGGDPEGATPLTDEELDGLIPDHVATRAELDVVEFEGIIEALPWARNVARRSHPTDLLTVSFLMALHRRMFRDVWRWAGMFRRRETNIGADPGLLPGRVKVILDDASYWHDHGTFDRAEIAARLHHRLVAVHPFPNGNGRCTRLLVDCYLAACGAPPLTWGGAADGDAPEVVRAAYLAALRAADGGDYEALLAFVQAERQVAHAQHDVAIDAAAEEVALGAVASGGGIVTTALDERGRLCEFHPDGTITPLA